MMRSAALVAVLLIAPVVAAEEAKPPAGPAKGGAEDPTLNLPDPDVLRPRAGLHVGFGAGLGVEAEQVTELQYVSGPEAVLHVDLNYGYLRVDTRLSFIGYRVMSSSRPVTGLGLMSLVCVHWNSRFMMSAGYGLVVQHDSPMDGDDDTTVYGVVMASPVTIRLGTRRSVEVGLQLVVPQDKASHMRSMAAYLSLSYLML